MDMGMTASDILFHVREMYHARDLDVGTKSFSSDDWGRTRIAFELLYGIPEVADIGIGQGQLVNLLARDPALRKVHGYDFAKHSKLLEPAWSSRYRFHLWNITQPAKMALERVDVVVAMEVLEHISVPALPEVLERLRSLSRRRTVLISVPYQESEPLFHHDKPHGHKQAFDDEKIEDLFGPDCLYCHYKERWYLTLCHPKVPRPTACPLKEFRVQARDLLVG